MEYHPADIKALFNTEKNPKVRFRKFKKILSSVKCEEKSALLESTYSVYKENPSLVNVKRVVCLIHGISTDASWFDAFKSEFKKFDQDANIVEVGYGWFNVFSFLFSAKKHNDQIARVSKDLLDAQTSNDADELYVVAHSFGTFLAVQSIKKSPLLKIKKLVLAGSIVSTRDYVDFPLAQVELCLNEVGKRDPIPLFASLISKDYGASGLLGLRRPQVSNRYHRVGHSGYLTNDHLHKYCAPYLTWGVVRETGEGPIGGAWGGVLGFLSSHPWVGSLLKLISFVVLPISFFYIYMFSA